jgi:hypothetical protein
VRLLDYATSIGSLDRGSYVCTTTPERFPVGRTSTTSTHPSDAVKLLPGCWICRSHTYASLQLQRSAQGFFSFLSFWFHFYFQGVEIFIYQKLSRVSLSFRPSSVASKPGAPFKTLAFSFGRGRMDVHCSDGPFSLLHPGWDDSAVLVFWPANKPNLTSSSYRYCWPKTLLPCHPRRTEFFSGN